MNDEPVYTTAMTRVRSNLKGLSANTTLAELAFSSFGKANRKANLSRLMNSAPDVTVGTLEKIAKGLGVDISEFFKRNSLSQQEGD